MSREIDIDWMRENAHDMTPIEIAAAIDSKPGYIRKYLREHNISCLATKPTPLPPEGMTRQWLLENRHINHQTVSRHSGISEKNLVRAYWRLCRTPGTEVPVKAPPGGCTKCAFVNMCTPERCMCESMQLWEADPMRPKRLADTA